MLLLLLLLPSLPSFIRRPPAEDRMTVRDIFYLLVPAARRADASRRERGRKTRCEVLFSAPLVGPV